MTSLIARSISRSVTTGPLADEEIDWRVLAVFERACNLVTTGGDVVALVLPETGDGPFNIVVERLDQSLRLIQSGMTATLRDTQLQIGELEIRLDQAVVWEPRPDWEQLRQNREQIESRLPLAQHLTQREAPADSLLALTAPPQSPSLLRDRGEVRSLPCKQSVAGEGWGGGQLVQLAGLGGGLTPAGDDFLMGVMLRAWLAHPEPEPFCQKLADLAAPRTTTLSAAMLRAAARGECSAAWHDLLAALEESSDELVIAAVHDVLAHGHTSGADTLAGFLWLPTPGSPDRQLC
ncbi:MAG: DUF2877 domain-containing protein [Anaerolineae bacterium]